MHTHSPAKPHTHAHSNSARPPHCPPQVHCVNWNLVRRDCFLSGSWDDTIKLWDLRTGGGSVRTFSEHTYCVYSVAWCAS